MSNAWFGDFDKEKLYAIRCEDCGEMSEFCFTVGEARIRFRLGITGHVDISEEVDDGGVLPQA